MTAKEEKNVKGKTTKKVVDVVAKKTGTKSAGASSKRIDFAKKASKEDVSLKKVAAKKTVAKTPKTPKTHIPSRVQASNVHASRIQVSRPQIQKPQSLEVRILETQVVEKKALEERPLVSVIIPVRNGARYIDSTIHSVLGQTFQDFELIIVDDSSDDGTFDIVKEFSSAKIKAVAQKEKTGIAKARNRGVEMAQGKYICFLDVHDMWQPEKLERQIEFMEEKKRAFSFTGYVFADIDGIPSGKAVRVPTLILRLQRRKVSAILTSTVMFDMSKLAKDDIMMPASKKSKKAIWRKALKKSSKAYGLNDILTIRGYDDDASLIKRIWRRV